MSANKSQHFQLNLWEPGDDFLREEFNENFSKLDKAARVVFGTYTGDGTETRRIELGIRPVGVLLLREDGMIMPSATLSYGGLAMKGFPAHSSMWGNKDLFAIDGSGLVVHFQQFETLSVNTNYLNHLYFYLAFLE